MSAWRDRLRWVIAALALELLWLFAAEAWREKDPVFLGALVAIGGPLLGASWHAFVKPPDRRRALIGALALAATMATVDVMLELVSPYPPRFAFLPWEIGRAASVIAGFAIGSAITGVRAWRSIALVACVVSLVGALLVPSAMLYIAIDGSRDSGAPGDTAFVLGFALAPDGSPQPQMIGRVAHAVELFKSGRVQRLVLSGGVARAGRTEADVMRQLALDAGVPASALVLELDSRSTIENFACGGPFLARLNATRVLLVTEPWHMTRAMLLARRHGLAFQQSPATSAIWESPRHASYWLFRDAVALIRERVRDPFATPGVCRARVCEGCRTF